MPRRQFVADLQQAVENISIAGVSDVQVGNDDGEFTFMCIADGHQIRISALIPELSDYPSSHVCMIFGSENASASVSTILDETSAIAAGKTVPQILELVSRKLESTDRDGDHQMLDSQEFEDFEGEEEEEEYDEEEEYFPGDEDMLPKFGDSRQCTLIPTGGFTQASLGFRQRVRHDLRTVKNAGFKVGHLGGLMDGMACYISVSIRVSKLGISEEAMQAWQLQPNEYLVAIFHYPNGYKNMDDLKSYDAATARRNFSLRVGISTSYKPDIKEAIQAFTIMSKDEEKRRDESQQVEPQQLAMLPKGFRNSFISRPLNELLEQRFLMILKYRYSGMPWQGAEAFYNDQILRPSHTGLTTGTDDRYYEPEQVSSYPSLVTADHIQESFNREHSLPLVGMQFVLRHFVRCTEFCLICFNKMADDLQAIKPYVCDNPLCLYQYMSLGFGPSIEHEILSQPKVVDLLVSFCYASARVGRLKDFPSGLGLAVPPPSSNKKGYVDIQAPHQHNIPGALALQQPLSQDCIIDQGAVNIKYNTETKEMLFEDRTQPCPVRNTDWIVIRVNDNPGQALHCRVIDVSLYPSVRVSTPVIPNPPAAQSGMIVAAPLIPSIAQKNQKSAGSTKEFRAANFYIYNQNFDDLSEQQKRQAITVLLDLLPPIKEMKGYLLRNTQSPLAAWVDRLSPAVLGVLRWIIASNRACILQTDHEDDTTNNNRKADGRLYGMSGWAQFRFAMGAPDKERRFIQAVRRTSDRLHLKYPTLFAWHGSPLQNWHSIIREGLHYNDTLHGRAFGNGVYHSLDANTSIGYSQFGYGACTWPMSELRIQHALALNEVVNAPQEFVSKAPHLVVAQLDWIQTRYLFVKTNDNYLATTSTAKVNETQPLEVLEQDPTMTPRGASATHLVIPIRAVANSRRSKPQNTTSNKRRKATGNTQYNPIQLEVDDDDGASVATFEEDRVIFFDDDDEEGDFVRYQTLDPLPTPNSIPEDKGKSKIGSIVSNGISKLMGSKKSLTDYVPGTLDYSTLPMLQYPAWATPSATKCLMKDFKSLIHVQNTTPIHELGWHIDKDKIENLYQWIVELHSFDPALPLAKEMKQRNIKSVVLELRFGKDYPMSPPFVRVIRPRFLGFQAGGGGHVTAGGAMCMELLTNDGWTAVSSIESVLLQVRVAISSTDPKPARLEPSGRMDYGVGEAVEAYMRACAMHGWTVPAGFKEMAYGGSVVTGYNSF